MYEPEVHILPPSSPQCYWVCPGLLLAGEYPGALTDEEARRKLRALLDAGIRRFVDLTEEGEYYLRPYRALLDEEAGRRDLSIAYHRMRFRDMCAPGTEQMRVTLDLLDEAVRAHEATYVHCLGGIGRTGSVVGCYLVRHGMIGERALERVAELFATMPKGAGEVSRSPETNDQCDLVRHWASLDAHLARKNRYRGSLLGLAAGDALGTTLEFAGRGPHGLEDMSGGGPFGLAPGAWTDDTSMALCLAESLIARRGFDARDQMNRYVRWWREGHLSSTGTCFDIGNTVRQALSIYESTGNPWAGSEDPFSAGNGSLMRLAPVALCYAKNPSEALRRAADSSRTTHACREALDACRYMAALIVGCLQGASKEELLGPLYAPYGGCWEDEPLCERIEAIARGSYVGKGQHQIRASGYVVHTLEAALWAFHGSDTFAEGCLKVVNLGEDADTSGAVFGELAGAYYGESAIPSRWLDRLAFREIIVSLADGLYDLSESMPAQPSWNA